MTTNMDELINITKYVSLTFENVEGVDVEIRYIKSLEFKGNKEECDGIYLLIAKEVNIQIDSLWQPMKLFDRFTTWNDIVYIELLDESKKSLIKIVMPWDCNKSSENNRYQTSRINGDGDLEITISKK